MSPRDRDRRTTRLRALRALPSLTPAERREYDALEQWETGLWRRLPRQIAQVRHKLADLEGYAAEIGLGPC